MLQVVAGRLKVGPPVLDKLKTHGVNLFWLLRALPLSLALLQKKVNPLISVESKPSNRARKMHEEKLKKQQLRVLVKRQREEEQRWHLEMRQV